MAKSTITSAGSTAYPGNASPWYFPLANALHAGNVTSTYGLLSSRPAGTYSNLRGRCSANSNNNTTTLRFTDGGANSACVVSITASSTGSFEDTSNTESVTDGSTCTFTYTVVNGSTGTALLQIAQIDFEPTDTTKTASIFGTNGVATSTTASATYYHSICGNCHTQNTSSEAATQIQFKKAVTLKNWRVRISADGRSGSTTYRLRKNGANANQSVSSSATGHFEDTTNTDSIAVDDKVNVQVVLPTGTGTNTWTSTAVNIETTDNISFLGTAIGATAGVSVNANTTRYVNYGYPLLDTLANINNVTYKLYRDAVVANLSVYIHNNTANGSTTIQLNDDGTNINPSVSVGSSATGNFSNTSNTATVAANSLICPVVAVGGSTGLIGVSNITHEVRPSITLYDRPISESAVSVSESLTRIPLYLKPISESAVTISETLARIPLYKKPISESAISTNDSIARWISISYTLAEPSISVSETLERIPLYLKPISESAISISETLTGTPTYLKAISNESAISVSETLERIPLYKKPISETAITTDDSIARWISISYTLAEPSISVSDSIQGALFYLRQISETAISVNDSISRILTALRAISDPAISISETLERIQILIKEISDPSISVSETLTKIPTYVKAVSDEPSISTSETLERLLSAIRTISEPEITVNDTVAKIQYLLKQISESSISVNDSVAGGLLFALSIVESRVKWYYSVLTRKIPV